jgi:hypothetical protein
MSYIYLASPYSHPAPKVRHLRYLEAMRAVAGHLSRREWVYSPIVHCHTLAQFYKLPTDAEFWHDYNVAMLDRAYELRILTLEGWQDSAGVAGEIAYAADHFIPITYTSGATPQGVTPNERRGPVSN